MTSLTQVNTSVPIGHPIANTQIYILDSHLHPVPVGVVGELYIGGDGLARGYLNRGDLTAECFIPHPFSTDPGKRLYKTGDLTRYLPDGTVEFLGRNDKQIKLSGFRIELGEIEFLLTRHPMVREAVAVIREDFPGDKRLVAYLVADKQLVASIKILRNYLKEHLPAYMIPSAFVLVDSLPLTANGKIDRQNLLNPLSFLQEPEESHIVPGTTMEQCIATVWQDSLHVKQIDIDDNFFDLGGNSLLMVQIHSKLQKAFNINIMIIDMFKYPTIRSLAGYLSREEQDERSSFQETQDRAKKRNVALGRQRQLMQKRNEE